MKLGIIGLPQTGKKTLFQLLTGTAINSEKSDPTKPIPGIAKIRDERFNTLVKMYEPKKEGPAQIDIQLLPKLEQNTLKENTIFNTINDVDALCHVVRAFESESVYHVSGSVDPFRDIDSINSELILHDLIFIEKRLERLEKDLKKQNLKEAKEEQNLMVRFKDILEDDKPLRTIKLSDEDRKVISGYPFLTMKKMLIVLNVDDKSINYTGLSEECAERYKDEDLEVLEISALIESEIALLDSEDEKLEFMKDAGIVEPALNLLTQKAMHALGLYSFFTVGKDEVKQWLFRSGSTAPVAASVIHSDIQRGFIRAEVMKFDDLISMGSEEALKNSGKFYTMGKDYIVEDGDIINFRFNV